MFNHPGIINRSTHVSRSKGIFNKNESFVYDISCSRMISNYCKRVFFMKIFC